MILAVCVAAFTSCTETFNSHYATRRQAEEAGAIGGSIPEWLPRSAADIRERHNIDTGLTLIAFSFAEAHRDGLVRRCEPGRFELPHAPFARPVTWWPADLGGAGERIPGGRAQHFRCTERTVWSDGRVEEEPAGLALRTDQPVAYYWR